MARRSYRVILLALLALLLVGFLPHPAQAQTGPACQVAAQLAVGKLSRPYSQGGNLPDDPVDAFGQPLPRLGPDSFDCSGLTWWAYQQGGVDIGTTTYQQVNRGQPLNCTLDDLNGSSTTCWAPGDLAFLAYPGGQHVSIYAGSGLFADAYNHDTGVILHDISQDTFYQSHFWQARRITSGCESMTLDPGSPVGDPTGSPPPEAPRFAAIPELVGYVTWRIPQCDECLEDGQTAFLSIPPLEDAPPLPTVRDWTTEYEISSPMLGSFRIRLLTPANGFKMIFGWLMWHIGRWFLILICWLFILGQWIVDVLAQFANVLLFGLNYVWRLLLFGWLNMRQILYALWTWLQMARDVFAWLMQVLAGLWPYLVLIGELTIALLAFLGELVWVVVEVILSILALMGWIVGISFGIILEIIASMQGMTVPLRLDDTHGVYYMTRGMLDGLHDSQIGWVMYLAYAMAYVAFIAWMAKFLPRGN